MNSNDVKQAFKAAGLKVRVADQGQKFRICTTDRSAHTAAAIDLAASLGLKGSCGPRPDIQQPHEMVAYKW
jgi:hypothetical protein